ncbi:MAG: amidohydrolase family protein [Oscillospiraceae bacterium]|nr:amidohydrolase family protein [Oscillospiraceae bacterium]
MLYECHGHIMLDGQDFNKARSKHINGADETAVREQLCKLKNAGVLYFRDGGDPYGVGLKAKNIALDMGIEFSTCAFAIHKKGSYGSILGKCWQTESEQISLIKEAKAAGADFIKLILSGLIDFNEYGKITSVPCSEDEIKSLVNIAHGEGLAVMAHVNGCRIVKHAIASGCDSIEHGCYMDAEGLKMLKQSCAVWVPTLAAIDAFVGREGFDEKCSEKIFSSHFESVKQAAQMGCIIAPGSDSGAFGVSHGAGIIREYELLKKAGVCEESICAAGERVRKMM